MDLILTIKGKEKKIQSQPINFGLFRRATEILKKYNAGDFLGNDYPTEEMDEAVNLICEYFNISSKQFETGFQVVDSTTFFMFFAQVLMSIQLNDGKREVVTDESGK
ncbi:hypothetical protein I6N96_01025 [Enterococcus sp. BWM-S5]|uniref:Phage protein n=1 Tax=Enterococcus larvae TaxID=2794352 RepID=A0ABS4CG67_9ENTE|nr:hypothetical protein [Enterococcus larvae]MBP1044844.1 hypothetical protein [Enterococcus larvae]